MNCRFKLLFFSVYRGSIKLINNQKTFLLPPVYTTLVFNHKKYEIIDQANQYYPVMSLNGARVVLSCLPSLSVCWGGGSDHRHHGHAAPYIRLGVTAARGGGRHLLRRLLPHRHVDGDRGTQEDLVLRVSTAEQSQGHSGSLRVTQWSHRGHSRSLGSLWRGHSGSCYPCVTGVTLGSIRVTLGHVGQESLRSIRVTQWSFSRSFRGHSGVRWAISLLA